MRNGSVASGPEALEILQKAARENDPYKIVLLDYLMPEMDGVELARQIKADPLLARIHLIMLTSLGTRLPDDIMAKTGIERCLQKPLRQSELFNAMASIIAEHIEAPARNQTHEAKAPILLPVPVRILVAEDNPVNQKVALRQLQKLGCAADAVSDGREALHALESIGYDIVLMDCHMPEMDGYSATRALRQNPRLKETYIIAMTANAMQGDREKCLAAGMDDYISKPTRLGDLEQALHRAVDCIAAQTRPESAAEPLPQPSGSNVGI